MNDALSTFFSLVWEGISLLAELGFIIMLPFLIIAAFVLAFNFVKSKKRSREINGLKGMSNETFGELKSRWFNVSQKYLGMESLYDSGDARAIDFLSANEADVRHFIREMNSINDDIRKLEADGARDSDRVTVVRSMKVSKAARVWNNAIDSRV